MKHGCAGLVETPFYVRACMCVVVCVCGFVLLLLWWLSCIAFCLWVSLLIDCFHSGWILGGGVSPSPFHQPYPHNIETAQAVEHCVRAEGCVPATIGIMDGRIKVGLSSSDIERLAQSSDVVKTSIRDLPFVLSQRKLGATTVAATMYAAHLAGIRVFVTGGIGGVHREGHVTMDVSADITELGRTPVAVVCAGVKSILDIPRTLEALETHGVPVATVGHQEEFPAFFAAKCGGCEHVGGVAQGGAGREVERGGEREVERGRERWRGRERSRGREVERGRERSREVERGREREREKERSKHTHTHTHTHTRAV